MPLNRNVISGRFALGYLKCAGYRLRMTIFLNKFSSNVCLGGFAGSEPSLSMACCAGPDPTTRSPIPVLWQNFIRTFNVPGRLDTVPSARSRSLASAVPATNTHTTTRRGKVWPPAPGLEPGSHHRHQRRISALISTRPRRGQVHLGPKPLISDSATRKSL